MASAAHAISITFDQLVGDLSSPERQAVRPTSTCILEAAFAIVLPLVRMILLQGGLWNVPRLVCDYITCQPDIMLVDPEPYTREERMSSDLRVYHAWQWF
jgi:hypothetical protein